MVPAAASAEHAVAGNLRLDRDQGLQTRRGRHGQIDLMPLTTPAERAVALCYLRAEKCCICPKRPAQKSRFVPQIVMNCALACPHDADGTATAKTAAEFMPWAAGPAIVRGSPVPLRLGRPLGRAAARVVGRSGARGRTAPGVSGWLSKLSVVDHHFDQFGDLVPREVTRIGDIGLRIRRVDIGHAPFRSAVADASYYDVSERR